MTEPAPEFERVETRSIPFSEDLAVIDGSHRLSAILGRLKAKEEPEAD